MTLNTSSKFLFYLLPIIPLVIVLSIYTYNFPFYDDYNTILDFLNEYVDAKGINQKASLIFSRHNEHYITSNKIITLFCFLIFKTINFQVLTIIGNIFFVTIWLLIIKSQKLSLLLSLACGFIFLNYTNWDNILWSMASLQNFGVVCLLCFTIWLFERNNHFLAFVLGSLTIFSSGNGFLVLPILLFLSIFKSEKKKWGVAMAIGLIVVVSFMNYQHSSTINNFLDQRITFSLIIAILKYFFSFIGALLSIPSYPILSVLYGLTLTFFLTFDLFNQKSRLRGIGLFILLTAALVTIGRFTDGPTGATISRYRVYSSLASILVLISFNDLLKSHVKKYHLIILLFGAIAFNSYTFYKLNFRLKQSYDMRISDNVLWNFQKPPFGHPFKDFALETMRSSYSRGIFKPKKNINISYPSTFKTTNLELEKPILHLDITPIARDSLILSGFAYLRDKPNTNNQVQLGNGDRNFGTIFTRRYNLALTKDIRYQDSGFFRLLSKKELQYLKFVFLKTNNKVYAVPIKLSK